MYIADGLRKLSTGGNAMYDSAASTCHIVLDADGPTVQSIRLVIICTCMYIVTCTSTYITHDPDISSWRNHILNRLVGEGIDM